MECKVSDLVKRGHDQVAELKSSCGAVDVRDVAQLISDLATQLDVQLARSNALAAENAGLKSAIEKHADSYIMCGYCRTERDGKNDDVCEVLDSIPATDAFLAEVRNEAGALAVELFAQTLGSPYSVRDEKCYEDGFTRAIEVVRDIQAPRFAYKIRQAGM